MNNTEMSLSNPMITTVNVSDSELRNLNLTEVPKSDKRRENLVKVSSNTDIVFLSQDNKCKAFTTFNMSWDYYMLIGADLDYEF